MTKRFKVFGIGFQRTGTSTLGAALRRLGFRHLSHTTALMKAHAAGRDSVVDAAAAAFDSFDDWPWPLVWRRMWDIYGPEARYVLTVRRDSAAWVESLKRHAERAAPGGRLREVVYGHAYPHGREAAHVAVYEAHNAAVRAFFAEPERRGVFAEFCWEAGQGWPELCGFLGLPVPRRRFPHVNASGAAQTDPARLAENLRRIAALPPGG